jgi:hypothetical protein
MIKELTKPRYDASLSDEPDIDVVLDTQANDYIDVREVAKRLNELEAENKRLREALETTEKTYLRAFRSGIPDGIWFEYFQPLVNIVKDALDTPRA